MLLNLNLACTAVFDQADWASFSCDDGHPSSIFFPWIAATKSGGWLQAAPASNCLVTWGRDVTNVTDLNEGGGGTRPGPLALEVGLRPGRFVEIQSWCPSLPTRISESSGWNCQNWALDRLEMLKGDRFLLLLLNMGRLEKLAK